MKPFPHGHEKGETAFKGIFRIIEGGYLIQRPITPQEVLKRFSGHLQAIYTHEQNERFLYSFSAHFVPFSRGFYAKLYTMTFKAEVERGHSRA